MTLFHDNPTILEECQLCMHLDHEENILCDSYIVEFDYDPTCNYYDRGKYGCRNFHVTKLPLVIYRLLLFLSCICQFLFALIICLPIRCLCIGSMLDLDVFLLATWCSLHVSIAIFRVSIINISNAQLKGFKEKRLLGGNPILFLFLLFRFCFALNNSSSLWLDVVLCFNQCLWQVRPLGQLMVIVDLILLKNRNLWTQENNLHNSQKHDFELILFAED